MVEGAEGPGGPVSVGEVVVRGGRVGVGGYDLGLVDEDCERREREGENVSTCVEQFCVWERAGNGSFLGVKYHHW